MKQPFDSIIIDFHTVAGTLFSRWCGKFREAVAPLKSHHDESFFQQQQQRHGYGLKRELEAVAGNLLETYGYGDGSTRLHGALSFNVKSYINEFFLDTRLI